MKSAAFLLLLLFLVLPAPTNAEEGGPKVGDAAPELRVSEWIKGEPVGRFEPGHVYVIDLWATWCAPCILAMPHLADVQRQYMDKNVTVIALDTMEKDVSAARALIANVGKSAEYRAAIDEDMTGEEGGVMAKALLGTNRAIPRCLIVDRDTKIAWIGHPMRVDGPLHAIVAGTYDAAKQAEIESTIDDLDRQLATAMRDKQWNKVLELLDQMHAADPFISPVHHVTRIKAFLGQGDYESATRFVKHVVADSDDVRLMGKLVGQLLSGPDTSKLDMEFVLSTAMKASRNGESDDPYALSALARAQKAKGDHAAAIKAWTKMLELADPLIDRDGIRERIKTAREDMEKATAPAAVSAAESAAESTNAREAAANKAAADKGG